MAQYVLFGRPLTTYILPILLLASILTLFSSSTLKFLASYPQTEALASVLVSTKLYYLHTKVYFVRVTATVGVLSAIVWVLGPGERPTGTAKMGTLQGSGKGKDVQAGPAWKGNPYRFAGSACNTCG
ncbi:hypothetical protein C8F01DRAFT_1082039 [Mycena amicta]|nr:hypothetical protein C8F01DRAFT_1082039 [Mycena amicta]